MVESADVGRDTLGCHLAAVELDGVIAEQYAVEAIQPVHQDGQGQDEER